MNDSPRIALVDDQALIRAGLRALLQQLGITIVFEADSGDALLEQLAQQPVQLILSDIRMPGMDGIQALKTLRERGDQTPCVFLTTFDESDLLLRETAATMATAEHVQLAEIPDAGHAPALMDPAQVAMVAEFLGQ